MIVSDLRYLRRFLARSPGQALAVWACTTVWLTVAPAYLALLGVLDWKSLPFPASERIVQINAGADLLPVLAKSSRFEAVSGFEAGWFVVEGARGTATVLGATVDEGFFRIFAIRPVAGRIFAPGGGASDTGGAVLTESCSRRLFGSVRPPSSAVFRAGGRELAVLGVVPDRPVFPPRAELWVLGSSGLRPDGSFLPPKTAKLGLVGRLSPDTNVAAAETMVRLAAREIEKRSETSQGDVEVVTLEELLRRRSGGERGILIVSLGGLLAFVLLVYSSALAGFLAERQGEMAIRMAFGARRTDLIRLLVLQIVVLAIPGFLAGLGLAVAVLSRLSDLVPLALAELIPLRVGPGSFTLAVAGWGLAVLVSALGVWLPSAQSGLGSLLTAERPEAKKTGSRSRARLALVGAALSLAVALGSATAVLRQSLDNLEKEPLGLEPKGAVSAVVRFAEAPEAEQLPSRLSRLRERLGSVPGVAAVSFSDLIPFGGASRHLEISTPDGSGLWLGRVQGIHGEYLRALGLRLLAGRDLSRQEQDAGASVALLDERSARTIFRGLPPLGRTLRVGDGLVEIVGIVPSTKGSALEEERRPQVYVPLLWKGRSGGPGAFAALLRLSLPVEEASVYEAIRAVPGASASQYRPVSAGVEASLAARRLARDMATLQWLATLALVALATFGTFSWLLEIRSFELAVRLALGDTRTGIVRRVLKSALAITSTAIGLGLAVYVPAGRLLGALLFGVEALSPVALLQAVSVVGGVALAAAALATRSALRRLSFDLLKSHRNVS